MFDVSVFGTVAGLLHSTDVSELMGHEAPLSLEEACEHAGIEPDRLTALDPTEAFALLTEGGVVPLTDQATARLEEILGAPAR